MDLNWYAIGLGVGAVGFAFKYIQKGIKSNNELHAASQQALLEIKVKLENMFATHAVVDTKIKAATDEVYEEMENVETRVSKQIEDVKIKLEKHLDKV